MTSSKQLRGVLPKPLRGETAERSKGIAVHKIAPLNRLRLSLRVLRNWHWRYGRWPDGEELYNLARDPQEKHNLAGKPHVAQGLDEFRQILATKQQEAAVFAAKRQHAVNK